MLALDFDGVVADALTECAAVTWFAKADAAPDLPNAIAGVPPAFLDTFAGVRAYSRTLDDFMVAHALHPWAEEGPVTRQHFERAREGGDSARWAELAAVAERVRGGWRQRSYAEWVGLHTVHDELAQLIRTTRHSVVVVSAKDRDSIQAILGHHQLDSYVDLIIGSCHDKRAALSELLRTNPQARSEGVVFVDDSVANVVAARDLDLQVRWAVWGYHGPEDTAIAEEHQVQPLLLEQLEDFVQLSRPSLVTTHPGRTSP